MCRLHNGGLHQDGSVLRFWWAGREVVAVVSKEASKEASKCQVQGMNRFKRTSFSLCVLGGRGGGRWGGRFGGTLSSCEMCLPT